MATKCEVQKTDGKQCGANAQRDKEVCVFHDAARAAAGRRARRLGGLNRNRPAAVLALDTPDISLTSTREVCLFLGESINQVRRGQLDGRIANTIGYLANILLGALHQGFLEERVSRIEAALDLEDNTQRKVGAHELANLGKAN